MCNCVADVNEFLKSRNTRLTQALIFGEPRGDNLMLQTEQIETGRGKRKASDMFLTYCPFCGENYKDRKNGKAETTEDQEAEVARVGGVAGPGEAG